MPICNSACESSPQRASGSLQGRNEPGELPRIGAELALLRGLSLDALAEAILHNTVQALPRLRGLLPALMSA